MGNKKQPVETKKRKKKGRPSLLELQKRSLRLQKQGEHTNRNPNPNPNPYLKFCTRRSTRRNPNPNLDDAAEDQDDEDEEEEEGESNGKRKEKKLKLVSRIPNGSDVAESGSDSDHDGDGERSPKKRKIDDVETARQNPNWKATDETPQVEGLDSGPTTALPDKKLLVFILDRLQKKDTYAVFSDPVDPEELPDYHDIIKNPMDFRTIRKRLGSGSYENLEQFESDVFLICSNAMRYNASDTIYFRQARSIQELAKKDFESLRQESDDNEQEPKTVRRGRPPIKHIMKRIGRPSTDRAGSDFSNDATLANARDGIHSCSSTRDLLRKGSSFDMPSMADAYRGNAQHRSERTEEYSGSPLKGIPMRNWKKNSVIDENRRITYSQPLQSSGFQEPSILTAFEGEKKLLMPVGLYMEHAYARSLARFAANLDPIGWEIAAKRIERVLPPGTKFGPGWIGDSSESTHRFYQPLLSSSSSPHISSQSNLSQLDCDKPSENHEPASNNSTPLTSVENGRLLGGGKRPKSPLQLSQNSTIQPSMNGFKFPQLPEVAMTHAHLLDMVSKSGKKDILGNHQAASFTQFADAEERTSLNPKPGSFPPDLNVDCHSSGSPVSGVLVDSKQQQQQEQPELALQL